MDQARTSPRNMIIAFASAAALALGAWLAAAGPAASSDVAIPKHDKASSWR